MSLMTDLMSLSRPELISVLANATWKLYLGREDEAPAKFVRQIKSQNIRHSDKQLVESLLLLQANARFHAESLVAAAPPPVEEEAEEDEETEEEEYEEVVAEGEIVG